METVNYLWCPSDRHSSGSGGGCAAAIVERSAGALSALDALGAFGA